MSEQKCPHCGKEYPHFIENVYNKDGSFAYKECRRSMNIQNKDYICHGILVLDFTPKEEDVGIFHNVFSLIIEAIDDETGEKKYVQINMTPEQTEDLQKQLNRFDFETNRKLQEDWSKENEPRVTKWKVIQK